MSSYFATTSSLGPLASVDIMSTTSTETTPSAVNEVAKSKHTRILPELYLLLSHKPATSFLTHPWQSNHCSTSDQTQQHNPLIFHSLPTQHHSTTAHTQQLGQTSTLLGPRLPPRPTKLTLNARYCISNHPRGCWSAGIHTMQELAAETFAAETFRRDKQNTQHLTA